MIIKEVKPVFRRCKSGRLSSTPYRLVWTDNLGVPILVRKGEELPTFTGRARDVADFLVMSETRNKLCAVPHDTII